MAEEGNKTTIAGLKIGNFQNPVENLPDRPTMSAAELKRHFDSNSEELREAFNRLIDALTGTGGASEIFTAAGISVEVALENRIQWNGAGVKYIRLNKDKVLETSEDGQAWEATGSGGHIILDRDGNTMPQRSRLFFDQCEVSDDGEKTVIHGIKGEKGESASNPNLLDNWYFADPINQRGKTAYTGSGYTVDRWKMFGDNASVSITGGALQIVSPAGENVSELIQIMEGKSIKGKRVTLSAMVNGAVVSGSGFFPTENGSDSIFYDDGNVALIARVFDTGYSSFGVWVYSGKTVNIQAVKLEYGSQQTLARQENGTWVLNDAPPNKASELAKCKAYYMKMQLFSTAYYVTANEAYVSLRVPTCMRTGKPSITVSTGRIGSLRDVWEWSIPYANAYVATLCGTYASHGVAVNTAADLTIEFNADL